MCRPSTNSSTEAEKLAQGEEWIPKLDLQAFAKEIKELGDKLEREQGDADVRHLNKIVGWSTCVLS